jgi:hypothetical protein
MLRGEAHYRRALALAEPRGMCPLVAHCQFGLGKLHRRRGDRRHAQEHLTTAVAMYREMGMSWSRPRLKCANLGSGSGHASAFKGIGPGNLAARSREG